MSVYPRGNGFEVCVTLPGGRRIREYARTRQQADLIEVKIRRQVPAKPVSDIPASFSFKSLLEACKNDWQVERGVRSFQTFFKPYCVSLEAFFGAEDIHQIDRDRVKKFKAWRFKHCHVNKKFGKRGGPASPATVGNSLKVLRRVFNFAIEEGLLLVNPVKGVKIPKGRPRIRFLEIQEQNSFLAVMKDDQPFQRLVWGLFRTGLRKGNLTSLKVSGLDPARSQTTHLETKSGKTLVVPFLPAVAEEFKRLAEGKAPNDYLVTNHRGKKWGNIYKRWYRYCRLAGIRDFRPHDCRHTFASDMLAAGVALESLMDFLGHATIAQTRAYAHLAEKYKKRDLEKYGEHLRAGGAFTPQLEVGVVEVAA